MPVVGIGLSAQKGKLAEKLAQQTKTIRKLLLKNADESHWLGDRKIESHPFERMPGVKYN